VRQIANIIGVIAVIAVNAYATVVGINGQSTAAVSNQFPAYFVPAGYVFSIWSIIYLGLIAFAIYQALPSQRNNHRIGAITPWFLLSCAANIIWLFMWHYENFPLTLVFMFSILISLIFIYLFLGVDRSDTSWGERLFVHVPFSIYLGWITVAAIANVTDVLLYYKWDGFGIDPQVWAVIMLVVAGVIVAGVIWTRLDIAYLAVIVWAFVGIWVKQASAPLVANTALIVAGVLVVIMIVAYTVLRGHAHPPILVR
jgi:translocator protein